MPVGKGEDHGIIAHVFPTAHFDAGKFLRALAAVLLAENVALADVFGAR